LNQKGIVVSLGMFILLFAIIFITLKLLLNHLIPPSHRLFIEKRGWEIANIFPEKEVFNIPEFPEALKTYSSAGVSFKGLNQAKIYSNRYVLKQKCHSRNLEIILFSVDDKIIGSYIDVTESVPGVTEMMDKDTFLHDICLY
jgi:hypothetical protein